jgi:hypothetical protein
VIDPAALSPLHEFFKQLPYQFIDSDRSDTNLVRHLVHYFDEDDHERQPSLVSLIQLASEFLGEKGIRTNGLERVYANFNLFGDFQFTHDDGDVWTALVFVNSRWNQDWGGEFLIYEDGEQPIALAVPVRPGRMVIFDGQLEHRGGVPSKFCVEARISVAIKFNKPAGLR